MKTKNATHTPGPWILNPGNHTEVWAPKAIGLHPENMIRIAAVEGYRVFADACLIAAAPELLAVAHDCLPCDDKHTRPFKDWDRADLIEHAERMEAAARATIAKAEGREG